MFTVTNSTSQPDKALSDDTLARFNKSRNRRKASFFYIGFLEGILSSGRIESLEIEALRALSEAIADKFKCPDASDMYQDLKSTTHDSQSDLTDDVKRVIEQNRGLLLSQSPYSETDELNEILGFCSGVVCDGKTTKEEIKELKRKLNSSPVLSSTANLSGLRRHLERILDIEDLSCEEAEEVHEWIVGLVGDGFADIGFVNIDHVSNKITDANSNVSFDGARVVISGKFRVAPRHYIKALVEESGGKVLDRVSKKVDYLILGSESSRDWSAMNSGRKIESMNNINEKGGSIKTIGEVDLLNLFPDLRSMSVS